MLRAGLLTTLAVLGTALFSIAQAGSDPLAMAKLAQRLSVGAACWSEIAACAEGTEVANRKLAALDGLLDACAEQATKETGGDSTLVPALVRVTQLDGISPDTHARLFCALAEACFRRSNLDTAAQHFARAAELAPSLSFHVATRCFFVRLAQNDYEAAYTELAAAAQAAATANDRRRTAQLRADLGIRIGLFDDAAHAMSEARVASNDDPYDLLMSARLEVEYALATEDFATAAKAAEQLTAIASAQGARGHSALQRARFASRQALARTEGPTAAIFGLNELWQDKQLLAANRPAIGRELVELLLAQNNLVAARTVANELANQRAVETLGSDELIAVAAVALAPASGADAAELLTIEHALEATWTRLLAEWQRLSTKHGPIAFLQLRSRRNLLSLLFTSLQQRLGDRAGTACLTRLLECDRAGATARALELREDDPAKVGTLLARDGSVIAAYLPASLGSHLLLIDCATVNLYPLPSDANLRAHVRRIRQALIANENEVTLHELAAPLAEFALPAPLRERLRIGASLIVLGRELLGGLPFELLPFADAQLPWLGLAVAIRDLPSLQIGIHLVRRPSLATAQQCQLLIGSQLAPADRERWQQKPVQITAAELADTTEAVAAAQVLITQNASVADLAIRLPRPQMLAVLAHGVYDTDADAPNGFLLDQAGSGASGAVFAPHCKTLQFGRMTFLGVCGASRSPLRRGDDGGTNLCGSILQAGADIVIASEWDLRADDALACLRALLKQLIEPMSAAEALRRARIDLYQHGRSQPQQWAMLRLTGLGDRSVPFKTSATQGSMTWLAVGAVALLASRLIARRVIARRIRTAAAAKTSP
jgi:hypothetical protein